MIASLGSSPTSSVPDVGVPAEAPCYHARHGAGWRTMIAPVDLGRRHETCKQIGPTEQSTIYTICAQLHDPSVDLWIMQFAD